MRHIGIFSLAVVCLLLLAGNTTYTQQADTLFYGDTPVLHENPFGAGYIAGTNEYGDIGKYQRFDFNNEIHLHGTVLHFGYMSIVGDPDTMNVVVREVESDGIPGEILASKEITTDLITVGTDGNYVEFDEPVYLSGSEFETAGLFIGFEWTETADDTFAVYADEDGEGEGAHRAWERFDDGSFNDFSTQLNPTFSWDLDTDLWISAIYSTTPGARLQVIHNAADPAAALVDIYVNGDQLLTDFGFRQATPFIDVPAEVELTIEVRPAGGAEAVGVFPVTLDDGGTYIAIANGVLDADGFAPNPNELDIEFTLFLKDDAQEESTDPNELQFIVVHGSTDAPAVDVAARGVATLVENAAYGAITDYIGVPGDRYILDIIPAGGEVPVASFVADLTNLAGGAATVLASGFLSPEDNQAGEAFGLIAVLADGTVIELPAFVDVSTVAELRAGRRDGTVYHLTGEAILTYQQSFRNQKFIQDTTAGILIDDSPGTITTAYDIYDGITGLTGRISVFGNMVQFVPGEDPGDATSSENEVIPVVLTMEEYLDDFMDYQSMLVRLENVSFVDSGTFANGQVYTITDGTLEGLFRTTFFGVDYINDPIPHANLNITGIPNSRSDGDYITARDWNDFELFYNVTFNVDMSYADAFDPETDDIYMSGSLAGWPQPGTDPSLKMEPSESDSMVYTLTLGLEEGDYQYKYFRVINDQPSWDNGEWPGDPNRNVTITDHTIVNDMWSILSPARLQVIHNAADPAAAAVDVYVNDDILLSGFGFREATPFINVPPGVELTIDIKPEGGEEAVGTFPVTLAEGGTYIAIANGVLDTVDFAPNPDELDINFTLFLKDNAQEESTEADEVQFIVVHGSTDAPTVDVAARGVGLLVEGAAYGAMTDYIGVPADEYVLQILPAGADTPVASYLADLNGLAGGAATVLASGFLSPENNQDGEAFALIAVLADGTVIELPEYVPTARLQVVHNAADPAAASVDVYVNGDTLLTDFGFRQATPFISVPAEVELTIDIKPAGGEDVVGTFPVTLADAGTYVAIANGVLDTEEFASNPDGLDIEFTLFLIEDAQEESTDPDEVQFIIVHGSTDAPTVDIAARDVAMLAENVPYGGISDYLGVPADRYIIDIFPSGADTPVASFIANLGGLVGESLTILASGFLSTGDNQEGEPFGLIAVLANGVVVELQGYFEVSSVAELRTKVGDGQVYTLTEEVVITFNSTFRGRKAIQDETAGIVIDDPAGIITTEYERYDGITGLSGTVGMFRNLVQFIPAEDPGPATSSGNVVIPEKYSFEDFELEPEVDISPKQGQLVVFEDVTVQQTGQWANQSNYTLMDAAGNTFPIRTDRVAESILYDGETTYIGTDIPEDPINIVGYVTQFDGNIQIVPRKLEDIFDASIISNFALVAPEDGERVVIEGEWFDEIVISWDEAGSDQDVSYLWIATLPELLYHVPLQINSDNDGAGTTLTVQKYQVDELLENLGIEVGDELTLKWTVVAASEDGRKYADDSFEITFERGTITNVNDIDGDLPVVFNLEQNYPNPFNPSTTINFAIPQQAQVTLEIYNMLGQRVRTLVAGENYNAGRYNVVWDGRDRSGMTVASGVYIYRINAGDFTDVKKMMFLK